MKRLIEKTVFCGLVTACRFATVPTSRSPDCVNATTDGVVRPPSAFSTTVGSPPSSTAMHELVVPRSIPIVFPICVLLLFVRKNLSGVIADLEGLPGVEWGYALRAQRPWGRFRRPSMAGGDEPLAGTMLAEAPAGPAGPRHGSYASLNALGHIRCRAQPRQSGRRA